MYVSEAAKNRALLKQVALSTLLLISIFDQQNAAAGGTQLVKAYQPGAAAVDRAVICSKTLVVFSLSLILWL